MLPDPEKYTSDPDYYATGNKKKVAALERQYDKILELAEKEYLDNPPSNYYREGYNLFKRLVKYKESELLFLHDKAVPANCSLLIGFILLIYTSKILLALSCVMKGLLRQCWA